MTATAKSDSILCSTAYLTAFFRSLEHERKDALFSDPYASGLCGFSSEQKAALSQSLRVAATGCILRTHITDRLLLEGLTRTKADTVVNLGAGLDTRPYRLRLPPGITWYEVDLPEMITYKKAQMAKQKPQVAKLKHVVMDLRDPIKRLECLNRVCRSADRVLVLSEGLLVYLHAEEVTFLAEDLRAQGNVACWITELVVSETRQNALQPIWEASSCLGDVMHFAPVRGKEFFEEQGWAVTIAGKFHDYYRSLRPHFQSWLTEQKEDDINPDQNILYLAMKPSSNC